MTMSKRFKITMILGVTLFFMMVTCSTQNIAVGQSFPSHTSFSNSSSEVWKESAYVDGVHTATDNYGSLDSSIAVTITLVDDVITSIQITPHVSDPSALQMQQRFADEIPAVVVGKRIDEVNIDRLAIDSRTPEGFKAAFEQIKEQNRIGPKTSRK